MWIGVNKCGKIVACSWRGISHVRGGGRCEVLTGFRWGNLREREHVQDLGVDGRIIMKLIFKKWNRGCGLNRSG
jgi:hypothetical protein